MWKQTAEEDPLLLPQICYYGIQRMAICLLDMTQRHVPIADVHSEEGTHVRIAVEPGAAAYRRILSMCCDVADEWEVRAEPTCTSIKRSTDLAHERVLQRSGTAKALSGELEGFRRVIRQRDKSFYLSL